MQSTFAPLVTSILGTCLTLCSLCLRCVTRTQPWRIELILRAQSILFRRYSSVLAPYKYAGYPLLLEALTGSAATAAATAADGATAGEAAVAAGSGAAGSVDPPHVSPGAPAGTQGSTKDVKGPTSHFLAPERLPVVQAAAELVALSACASATNASELARVGGVPVLASLLHRCCLSGLPTDVAPTVPTAILAMHLGRAIAGCCASEPGRRVVGGVERSQLDTLLRDLLRCTQLAAAHGVAEAALVALGHLVAAPNLASRVLELGGLAYLLPLMFRWMLKM